MGAGGFHCLRLLPPLRFSLCHPGPAVNAYSLRPHAWRRNPGSPCRQGLSSPNLMWHPLEWLVRLWLSLHIWGKCSKMLAEVHPHLGQVEDIDYAIAIQVGLLVARRHRKVEVAQTPVASPGTSGTSFCIHATILLGRWLECNFTQCNCFCSPFRVTSRLAQEARPSQCFQISPYGQER